LTAPYLSELVGGREQGVGKGVFVQIKKAQVSIIDKPELLSLIFAPYAGYSFDSNPTDVNNLFSRLEIFFGH